MKNEIITCAFSVMLFALYSTVEAQPQGKSTARVGWLWYGAATAGPLPSIETAIIDGLQELGYVDGKTIVFEHRFADGRPEKLPELAAALVQQKVDVIIGLGGDIAAAAKKATQTIPIVVGTSDDPVRASIISSLARPGGNITGLSIASGDLNGKRLELLKEVVPQASRVAVLWNAANPANASAWQETQAAARALGLLLQSQEVRGPQDFEGAFALTAKARPDALLVLGDALINMHRQHITEFATQQHLPSVFVSRESVVAGGLMSYGPSVPDLFRRAATYGTHSWYLTES